MITIITVCFNAASDLEKTILSVLKQKDADIEYIIKDGKSSDNTNEVIEKYRTQLEERFNFIYISEKDKSLYDAMNIATDIASGDKILFLNAGDRLFDDNVINSVSQHDKNNEADIVYGDLSYSSNGKYEISKACDVDELHAMKHGMCFGHPATFIKTSLMKEYKYNLTYKLSADYEFLLRCYLNNKKFKYINIPISHFEVGGLSDIRVFDMINETYDAQYNNGVLSEENYKELVRKNEIKRFSRKIIPIKLYNLLKRYKRKYIQRNWDKIS